MGSNKNNLEINYLNKSPEQLHDKEKFDIVLSDMAASTTGHKQTDHIRTQALAELAAIYATEFLKPGGIFCAKVFQGGTHGELLLSLKNNFKSIKHFKPDASRKASPETYLIAKDFKG